MNLHPRCATSRLIGAAMLAAFLALPAWAEPMFGVSLVRDADMSRWTDNYVEFGLGYNAKDSFKFGEYSGIRKDGAFALGGFNWLSRSSANDALYWRAYGANLGLDSRRLLAEGGQQGLWNLSFALNQLTRAETDSARFIYQGLGTNSLTLPAGYPAGGITQPPTNGATTVLPFLNGYDIKQSRDIYRLGLSAALASNWEFKVNYREDRRDGTRLTGAAFGTTGGNPRAVIVPYPLDDRTRQVEAVLAYSSRVAQLQILYAFSRYENDVGSFGWQNPYGGVVGGVTPVGTVGRLSLMPGNDYHQVSATGAYQLSKVTRLTGQMSYAVAQQNEAFLPYTSNPSFAANGTTSTASLPRSSLDGRVVNSLLDVALTTRPVEKMNLKVGYLFRESDNRTPQAQYRIVHLDTCDPRSNPGGACGTNNERRTNVPVSSRENKLVADADYEIAARTRLRGLWEHRDVAYRNADRDRIREDKFSAELRRAVSAEFTGALRVTRTERRGSDYNKNQFFAKSYDPAFIAAQRFDNNPQMRQFLYADYDENRVRMNGNWNASETVSLQGGLDLFKQRQRGDCSNVAIDPAVAAAGLRWTDQCLGRKSVDGTVLSLDAQWQPEENLTTFGFYNYTEQGFDQAGRTWGAVAQGPDTTRTWIAQSNYRDHTLGIGLKWQPHDAWDLGGQFVHNIGRGRTAVLRDAGTIAAPSPVPDLTNSLNTLQLFAKWKYSKELTLRFNYWYERLSSYDWAYSDASATSTNNVVLTGQSSPRYSNHVIGISAALQNW